MTTPVGYPRFRWAVLVAMILGCVTVQTTSLALAPVLPQIAEGFGIDIGTASNYVNTTFLFTGSLVGALLGGYFSDRFGVLNALIVGLALATVPAALMPWIGTTVAGLAWARIVEGLSQGFVFPAMGPVMARWFPVHQRGMAGGLMSSAVAMGSSAGVFLGPAVFDATGDWRATSAWLSIAGWVSLAFALSLARVRQPDLPALPQAPTRGSGDGGSPYRRALTSRLTLLGIGVTFLSTWALQCLYTLTSTFLAAEKPLGAGYGAVTAGQLTLGVTLAGGIVGPLITGLLLDRVFHGNPKPTLLAGFALMSACVYALRFPGVTGNLAALVSVLILGGFGAQFALPTIFYFVARSYAPEMVGKMTGLWTGLGAFGGVVGVYIAGVTVARQNSYATTFAIQAGVAMAAFVLTFALVAAGKTRAAAS